MLERLHGLAVRLHPFRQAVAAAGLLCVALIVVALLRSSDSDILLRMAILGTLWCGLVYASTELFHHVPRRARPGEGVGVRLALGLKRLFSNVLAALILLFALVLFWMSMRLAFV